MFPVIFSRTSPEATLNQPCPSYKPPLIYLPDKTLCAHRSQSPHLQPSASEDTSQDPSTWQNNAGVSEPGEGAALSEYWWLAVGLKSVT